MRNDVIKCIDPNAAQVLASHAANHPDLEVASVTPEILHCVFPEQEHAALRVEIMKVISSKREVEALDARFTSLEEAVCENRKILENMKNQVDRVETLLKNALDLLSQPTAAKPVKKLPTLPGKAPSTKKKNFPVFLVYQTIVCGETFGAYDHMMKTIKENLCEVKFVENKKDHSVTILFCPISSRIGVDVKAAMSEVKDDKPIILVLMNHSYQPRSVPTQRTWEGFPNIEWFVNVFYHETKPGLIDCVENDQAIQQIQQKLQLYCIVEGSCEARALCGMSQGQEHFNDDSQVNQSVHGDSQGSQLACDETSWGIFSRFRRS